MKSRKAEKIKAELKEAAHRWVKAQEAYDDCLIERNSSSTPYLHQEIWDAKNAFERLVDALELG